MRERFSRGGLAAISFSLILIALGAFLAWKMGLMARARNLWNTAPVSEQPFGKAYLLQSTLPGAASSAKSEVAELLLAGFRAGRLYTAGEWPVPRREGTRMVLAAPTQTGEAEPLRCGFIGHKFCGLYLVTPTSTALAAWGDALTGLSAVERFTDPTHVVLTLAWTFFDYTTMEHSQLNLQTGELIPLLKLELDVTDDSAELQVSGQGTELALYINGELEKSRLVPKKITLQDSAGRTLYLLPAHEVEQLAEASRSNAVAPAPALILPSNNDVESQRVRLLLFGRPFELDIKSARLINK